MCSIIGFIKGDDGEIDFDALIEAVHQNEPRGPHACGVAWVDETGRMYSHRAIGRLTDRLEILEEASDAHMMVIHMRWATVGNKKNVINAHPHPCDGGWMVHNGTLHNQKDLVNQWGLMPTSECDSEIYAMMVERSRKETMTARCVEAVRELDPYEPFAMIGLWKPGHMVALRRDKPLSIAKHQGCYYMATVKESLPGKPKMVPNWSVLEFTDYGDGVTKDVQKIMKPKGYKKRAVAVPKFETHGTRKGSQSTLTYDPRPYGGDKTNWPATGMGVKTPVPSMSDFGSRWPD